MALISQQYDIDPMVNKTAPVADGPEMADPDLGGDMVPGAQPVAATPKVGETTTVPGASPPATSPKVGETTPATPPTPPATPGQPVPRTVDESRETVAGQLRSLLSEDSPVLQQARARAMQQMNARGLVNSSMANSAATDAVIQSALPIASADAGVYGDVARLNQGYQNEAVSDERRQAFQQSNMQLASQLDTGSRERLMAIEQNYRQITQGSNAASALLQDMQSRIGVILANPDIPIENKQGMIDQMIESSMRSATLIGAINGLDFSDLFGGSNG